MNFTWIQLPQCKNNKTGEIVAIKKIKLESEDEGVSRLFDYGQQLLLEYILDKL